MTTDTGLTNRLRQHSRRAGLAVGLTVALTIAICIGGFAVIYAQLQPFISDFVSQDPPDDDGFAFDIGRRDQPTPSPPAGEDEEAAEEESDDEGAAPAEPTEPPPTPEPTQPTVTDEFVPDLQISTETGEAVRLRSEPSTQGGEATIITTLLPATPLQFLGERAPTEDPAVDGEFWLNVRTSDGNEGWVRAIDTEPYDPNA